METSRPIDNDFRLAYNALIRATGLDHATVQWDYWATNSNEIGVADDLCALLDARGRTDEANEFRRQLGLLSSEKQSPEPVPLTVERSTTPERVLQVVRATGTDN